MKEALIYMIISMGLDLFLIFIVSFISVMVMESKKLKNMRAQWNEYRDKLFKYLDRLSKTLAEDWKYEEAGCLILFFAIIVTLISACALAYYVPFEKIPLWNVFEKFIKDHPLFTSVMGTFIGVVVIFCIMRPRVRIDKNLIVASVDNEPHLKIRIRNLGIFQVNNIEVQLLFYRKVQNEDKTTKKTKNLELLRAVTPTMPGILPKGKDSTYGCITKLSLEKLQDVRMGKGNRSKEYEGILCRAKATHAISGVVYIREREFKKEQIDEFFKKNCSVRTCNDISTEIVCDKIISDIEEVNEQMKDIKKNVKVIQKENKKNQKS